MNQVAVRSSLFALALCCTLATGLGHVNAAIKTTRASDSVRAASVSWSLMTDQSVSATAGPVVGLSQTLRGMEISGYSVVAGSGPGKSQSTQIAGGTWPAETHQNSARFIQFTISPKTGITFRVDTISMYYTGRGGGQMKANMALSTDSNFASSTQLNPAGTPVAISSTSGTMSILAYTPAFMVNPGQTLYFRIYPWYTLALTNKFVCLQNVSVSGTATGSVIPTLPVISTTDVTDISTVTAVSGGTVAFDGDAAITARGVCWNTAGNPDISGDTTSDGTGSGVYTSTVSGLTASTKYYVRAYATNIAGTAYGNLDSLTTRSGITIPTVITTDDIRVVGTSAQCVVNVTDWGGAAITTRGVCCNTTGNPTVSDMKTSDGGGVGQFTSILFGLSQNTTYYVRAYATNGQGTAYGDVKTFAVLSTLKGATGDGIHKDTRAIQAAIDSTSTAGGGVVRFMNGIYLTAPFTLKGNVTLLIDSSARILASPEFYDFYPVGFDTTGGKTPTSVQPLIISNHADNLTITGNGTIDGNGKPWWDAFNAATDAGTATPVRPYLIILKYGHNIRVTHITLTNSPMFHFVPQWCIGVVVDSVTILAPSNAPNTDGIDPGTCHNVQIRHCLIDVGDDNVAIKSGSYDPAYPNAASSNITISDCTFLHGHGVSIGSETNGGVDSMLVTNCSFTGTDNGLRIKSNRTKGGNVRGVTYNNITMSGVAYPILFSGYYPDTNPLQTDTAQPVTSTTPYFHDITISNVTSTGSPRAGQIIGLPEKFMTNILLQNVTITATTGLRIRNAQVKVVNTAINVTSGPPYIFEVNGTVTGVMADQNGIAPAQFSLSQNYPNPFNPATTITFTLAEDGHVSLRVYDILGREVATLVNAELKAGVVHRATLDASRLASGVYFYRLDAGTNVQVKKLLLLK